MHCGKVQRLGEEGWWLTKQMKQLYRSLLDWAEYAYVLLFITIVITVYSIFYLFWATKPRKKNAPAKSTVLDGHPDRNIENIIKIQTQKSTIDDLWPYVLRGAAQQC